MIMKFAYIANFWYPMNGKDYFHRSVKWLEYQKNYANTGGT